MEGLKRWARQQPVWVTRMCPMPDGFLQWYFDNYATGATVINLNKKYKIAQDAEAQPYEHRNEVVRETTLKAFKANPDVIPDFQ